VALPVQRAASLLCLGQRCADDCYEPCCFFPRKEHAEGPCAGKAAETALYAAEEQAPYVGEALHAEEERNFYAGEALLVEGCLSGEAALSLDGETALYAGAALYVEQAL
jgi:hypothetical protein